MDLIKYRYLLVIKTNPYYDDIPNDKPFFFNYKCDENGKPILGDGSDEDHLLVCGTSKNMLDYGSRAGCKHLDCTYKLVRNGFSFLVYGVTDMVHKFFPIAFGKLLILSTLLLIHLQMFILLSNSFNKPRN
jgi:hypothetical protein